MRHPVYTLKHSENYLRSKKKNLDFNSNFKKKLFFYLRGDLSRIFSQGGGGKFQN